MRHLNEEQLTLLYYHEPGGERVEEHLGVCEACRTEYSALERTLDLVKDLPIPEPGPGYEARIWRGVAPVVRAPHRRGPVWAAVGVAAALVVAAFFAGRATRPEPPVQTAVRQRVLLVAVGDHLERSRMVLVELANARAPRANGLDISFEQGLAEDLLDTNRLYRQTARSTGDVPTADMLEDLERILMEIVHSPSTLSAQQLEDLRQQITDRKILSKTQGFKGTL